MNIKILLASFTVIFLAELGDKTQLTALAFSTSSRSPFSVFIGTSLALICTTALAVVFGEALSRVVPERVLQLVSAVLFVLVGLALLVNLARKAPAEEAEELPGAAAVLSPSGPLATFVARQAIAFEDDLVAFIRETASDISDPLLREELAKLEARHKKHADALSGLQERTDEDTVAAIDRDLSKGKPEVLLQELDAAAEDVSHDALAQIIQRQEAAANFYIALARLIDFHDAKDILRALSMEEIRMAQDLCELSNRDLHGPDSPAADITA